MIGKKVFVYMDDDGHYSVFPYETHEDKVAIYEAAVNKVVGYLEQQKQGIRGGNLDQRGKGEITQADIDGCKTAAAKNMLEAEFNKQQKKRQEMESENTREDKEIRKLQGLLEGVRNNDSEAETDLDDVLIGHEIRLDGYNGGECTICTPEGMF